MFASPRVLVSACLIVGVSASLAAASPERYQEIEFDWTAMPSREALDDYPELEVMRVREGVSVRFLSHPDLTEQLRSAGYVPRVVHDDLEAFYRERYAQTTGRGGGAFGDFTSYSEMVDAIDLLHATYPDLTTDKIDIGTTGEGRTIWAMKISDNPDTDEDEPEVLFDALHHAREPITVSVLLHYMNWLCENHGSDPEATYLVDEREIWFVPVVNPDGYAYNEATDPGGGGLWRKNRRDNPGSSCDGVDPNRNYSFVWGGEGAEGDPCSEVYYGSAPFSEPETQALRQLMIDRDFVTHNSYHAVAGQILFPWGYTTADSPDHDTFQELGDEMNRDAGYQVGSIAQVLYIASGASVDYAYGEQVEKGKVFSFTTEVGGSGFWPQESEIPGLVAENLHSNIVLTRAAGGYVRLDDVTVTGGDGNDRLDPGETASIVLEVANEGVVATASNVSFTLASSDPYVSMVDASASTGDLGPGGAGDTTGDPFTVSVDGSAPAGHEAAFTITLTWDAGSTTEDLVLFVGDPPVIASEDFEGGDGGWTSDGDDTATTGQFVSIDPNPTSYQPGDDTTPAPGVRALVTAQNSSDGTDDVDGGVASSRSPVVDLSGVGSAILSLQFFHGQRDPGDDPSGDFFRIQLSNDGGTTFPVDLVSEGDAPSSAVWRPLTTRLEEHLPLTDQMVLRVQAADGPAEGDLVEAGLDDVVFLDGGSGNQAPGAPIPVSPVDGQAGLSEAPVLTVANASDPEGDPLTYTFRVYADPLLQTELRSGVGVVEGSLQTSWTVDPPLGDGTYYWRAHAEDDGSRGLYSSAWSFVVSDAVGVSAAALAPGAISAAVPNPFAAGTTVRMNLIEAAPVRADVFDVSGRHVHTLFRGILDAGPRSLRWDGRDRSGHRVAAGPYFVQLTVAGSIHSRKVVVVD